MSYSDNIKRVPSTEKLLTTTPNQDDSTVGLSLANNVTFDNTIDLLNFGSTLGVNNQQATAETNNNVEITRLPSPITVKR